MIRYVHEVFDLVAKAAKKEEKIKILQDNDNIVLRTVLFATYSDKVKFNLPEGTPPYTPSAPHNTASDLKRKLGELKYFIVGSAGDNMVKFKREHKFVQLLEGIHPRDAEVVLTMVAKKSPAKGITVNVVKEAFPDLLK